MNYKELFSKEVISFLEAEQDIFYKIDSWLYEINEIKKTDLFKFLTIDINKKKQLGFEIVLSFDYIYFTKEEAKKEFIKQRKEYIHSCYKDGRRPITEKLIHYPCLNCKETDYNYSDWGCNDNKRNTDKCEKYNFLTDSEKKEFFDLIASYEKKFKQIQVKNIKKIISKEEKLHKDKILKLQREIDKIKS